MRAGAEPIRAAVENIERYAAAAASLDERVDANLFEIARNAAAFALKDMRAHGSFSPEILAQTYRVCVPSDSPDAAMESADLLQAKTAVAHGAYLADLARKIAAALRASGKVKPSPALFFAGAPKTDGICVSLTQGNALVAAFRAFSREISGLTPNYVRSFADACEDVAAGISDFCILPIENARDGGLTSVYGMIGRYDLFISALYVDENEENSTKFALLCRGFRGMIGSNSEQSVSVRLSGTDAGVLSSVFCGAAVIGAVHLKTLSVPLGYTDGYAQISTFSGNGETLFALLLFLTMLRVDFTLIGAYETLR